MTMTLLAVYRPHWVNTFFDRGIWGADPAPLFIKKARRGLCYLCTSHTAGAQVGVPAGLPLLEQPDDGEGEQHVEQASGQERLERAVVAGVDDPRGPVRSTMVMMPATAEPAA